MNPKKDGTIDFSSVDQDLARSGEITPGNSTEADLKAQVSELQETVKLLLNRKSNNSELPTTESKFEKMLEVILKREERLAKAEEVALTAHEARMKQRLLNQDRTRDEETIPQKNCKHLKGGKGRRKNQAIDYAVYHHQFVDGSKRIRCTLCGAYWGPEDTAEYLFRRGKKIANHTGLGWLDAVKMVEQSTNQPSRSEIRIDVLSQKEAERAAAAKAKAA